MQFPFLLCRCKSRTECGESLWQTSVGEVFSRSQPYSSSRLPCCFLTRAHLRPGPSSSIGEGLPGLGLGCLNLNSSKPIGSQLLSQTHSLKPSSSHWELQRVPLRSNRSLKARSGQTHSLLMDSLSNCSLEQKKKAS